MIEEAIVLAHQNVLAGGGPFGAIVVMPDGTMYTGVNKVTQLNDPTAHAEVTAIRNACAGEKSFSLLGAKLYTSCEPCPMCLGAALWSRIDIEDIYYAANRYDAAKIGFDDEAFYDVMANERPTLVKTANKLLPFDEWHDKIDTVAY